jgi:lysozyme family protein
VAASSYNRSLAFVLKYEGGYVNHPADPGGPTNLGVTQQTLSNYLGRPASIEEVKALTPGKVGPIYKKRYWDAVRGNDLPAGLDLVVFDFAVNSGPARATKALQKLVGVAQDGVMGMDTVAAVEREDAEDLIRRYCANRLAFLKGLTTWGTFGKGWGARVAACQKLALAMESPRSAPEPVEEAPPPVEASKKGRDQDQKVSSTPEAKAGGITAIGTIGSAAAEAAEKLSPFSDAAEVVKYVCIVLTVIGVAVGLYLAVKKARSSD